MKKQRKHGAHILSIQVTHTHTHVLLWDTNLYTVLQATARKRRNHYRIEEYKTCKKNYKLCQFGIGKRKQWTHTAMIRWQ